MHSALQGRQTQAACNERLARQGAVRLSVPGLSCELESCQSHLGASRWTLLQAINRMKLQGVSKDQQEVQAFSSNMIRLFQMKSASQHVYSTGDLGRDGCIVARALGKSQGGRRQLRSFRQVTLHLSYRARGRQLKRTPRTWS